MTLIDGRYNRGEEFPEITLSPLSFDCIRKLAKDIESVGYPLLKIGNNERRYLNNSIAYLVKIENEYNEVGLLMWTKDNRIIFVKDRFDSMRKWIPLFYYHYNIQKGLVFVPQSNGCVNVYDRIDELVPLDMFYTVQSEDQNMFIIIDNGDIYFS